MSDRIRIHEHSLKINYYEYTNSESNILKPVDNPRDAILSVY